MVRNIYGISLVLLGSISLSLGAQEATTRVEGTFVLPAELGSFKDRTVEIRLYRFDPRIADKAADLIEKIDIQGFSHIQEKETKKEFIIGAKGKLEPKMSYYLTLFVLEGKQRTHIGECDHDKKNLCRVLTGGNPNKVRFSVREVKK